MADVPPRYSITVKYSHPTTKDSQKVAVEVDTGFNGHVTVSREIVDKLKLPYVGLFDIGTATRQETTEGYATLISIPELRITDCALTAYLTSDCLLGRRLLLERRWLIDNISNIFCLWSH